ncbi:MAG: LysR substrate-binding domain-containing protein [Alphaproteobacteria bacterium]
MELSDLRIFKAVVEEGGITRAAERLHRVQSNVTTRIRQLEDDLGVELFVREGRGLYLAPVGRTLVGYADRLLELADEARNAVQDSRPRGLLRVGSMESTASVRLPEPLSRFCNMYPDVTLELSTGNPEMLSKAILAGEIDVAFAAEPIADEPFEAVHAFTEEHVIVSSAEQDPFTEDRDGSWSLVAFEPGCPHRKRLLDWVEGRGEVTARLVEMGSYHAILGCVVIGMGISLMPKSVLDTFPEKKRLRIHPLPKGQDSADTLLFWRRGSGSPNVDALAELISTPAPTGKKSRGRQKKAA